VLDAALISAMQRIEHYQIAVYGTLRAFCEQLGLSACARLLSDTLDEEIATDEVLSQLAIGEINMMAEGS
jgi:ferritin-like metal-binding protein YciE